MRRLRGLAEQRDLVESVQAMHLSLAVTRFHQQRVDDGLARRGEPSTQMIGVVLVHQEADGAAMHAVDRLAGAHEAVQRLQHEAVAAERDDHIGGLRRGVAVVLAQALTRLLGFGIGACQEGDRARSSGW